MKQLTDKLILTLISRNIIKEDDKEIKIYKKFNYSFNIFNKIIISSCICTSLLFNTKMLIIGKIYNIIK